MHISHKELESRRLPELLRELHIQITLIYYIPQYGLNISIANKLLYATIFSLILGKLRHFLPTLEFTIILINLRESDIKSPGQGYRHNGVTIFCIVVAMVVRVAVPDGRWLFPGLCIC